MNERLESSEIELLKFHDLYFTVGVQICTLSYILKNVLD